MWGNIQLSHIWTGCNLYLIFIYSVSKSHHSGWTSDSWPYHTLPLVQLARCPPGGSLPRSICLVNLVQQLDVSSNRLTELPAALGKLPLRELCVANNQTLGLDIWRKSPVNLKAKFWCAGKISRKTMENPTLNWTLTWTFWLNKFSFWGTIWMKTPTLNGQLVGKVLWFLDVFPTVTHIFALRSWTGACHMVIVGMQIVGRFAVGRRDRHFFCSLVGSHMNVCWQISDDEMMWPYFDVSRSVVHPLQVYSAGWPYVIGWGFFSLAAPFPTETGLENLPRLRELPSSFSDLTQLQQKHGCIGAADVPSEIEAGSWLDWSLPQSNWFQFQWLLKTAAWQGRGQVLHGLVGPPCACAGTWDAVRIDASNNQLQQLPEDLTPLGENLVNIQLAQNRLLKLPDAEAEFAIAFSQ